MDGSGIVTFVGDPDEMIDSAERSDDLGCRGQERDNSHSSLGEPAGLVPDLVGPKVYGLGELARDYLRAKGKHRLSLPIHVPGKVGKVYRAGGNLTLSGADVGTHTWEDFLSAQV